MGNGCTNAKIIEPKPNEVVTSINHEEFTEKISSLEQNELKMLDKLSKIENKLYKEFPEKEKIPISTCYEIYYINGKKIEIPFGLYPLDKMEMLEWYKKNT